VLIKKALTTLQVSHIDSIEDWQAAILRNHTDERKHDGQPRPRIHAEQLQAGRDHCHQRTRYAHFTDEAHAPASTITQSRDEPEAQTAVVDVDCSPCHIKNLSTELRLMIYELIFQDIFRDFYLPHHPADHKDKVLNNHKLKSRLYLKRLRALDHTSRALRAASFGVGQELMAEIVSFANNDYTRRRDS
jgi:hypothetical protein